MSNSTFLITNRGTFSIKQTRIGLISLGFIMVIFNLMIFLETGSISNVNPFLVVMGISFIITGTVGLSKDSKFSPKVFLNDEFISIKENLWSGGHKYYWSDIHEITLGSYQLTINAKNKPNTFNIDSTPQISIDIKKAVKLMGQQKNITIIGN